jgi:gas vesicle protein
LPRPFYPALCCPDQYLSQGSSQSGKRTRRELRRKAEDAQDYLEEIGEDLIAKGRELVERGREAADSTVKDFTEKVKEVTS